MDISLLPAISLVQSYNPGGDASQEVAKDEVLGLLDKGSVVLVRSHMDPGHVTASAWIQSPCQRFVLLCHHRKLGQWLQLGGHVDGDPDILGAALREAREESGIDDFEVLIPGVFDLDIHTIPARRDEPAHQHFDVRFLLRARSMKLVCSEESLDLRWVPREDIPSMTEDRSVLRMASRASEWSAS